MSSEPTASNIWELEFKMNEKIKKAREMNNGYLPAGSLNIIYHDIGLIFSEIRSLRNQSRGNIEDYDHMTTVGYVAVYPNVMKFGEYDANAETSGSLKIEKDKVRTYLRDMIEKGYLPVSKS